MNRKESEAVGATRPKTKGVNFGALKSDESDDDFDPGTV